MFARQTQVGGSPEANVWVFSFAKDSLHLTNFGRVSVFKFFKLMVYGSNFILGFKYFRNLKNYSKTRFFKKITNDCTIEIFFEIFVIYDLFI
jgi:hypothetical protein